MSEKSPKYDANEHNYTNTYQGKMYDTKFTEWAWPTVLQNLNLNTFLENQQFLCKTNESM